MLPSDELVIAHLRLVDRALRRLRVRSADDRDELRSAGHVALVQAARRFDPGRGTEFASYALLRVRGAMLDELRRIARNRARTRPLEELPAALAREPGDQAEADQRDHARHLLSQLDSFSRAVVVGRVMHGRSLRSLAAEHRCGHRRIIELVEQARATLAGGGA